MRKTLYLLVFFIVSCTSNTILKKPNNLIPKEQMIALLTDMYIANAANSVRNINRERKINYMPLVFEKHKIDSARFAESNKYYTSTIDDYKSIYKEVQENILEMLEKEKDEKNNDL